jgi:hypothetical protein
VEFEFVVEMNLVQIGTNEFFPQLIRLAANERLSFARILSAFEMNNIQRRRVTCYRERFQPLRSLAKDSADRA